MVGSHLRTMSTGISMNRQLNHHDTMIENLCRKVMHVTATESRLRGAILLPTSACWVPHIHHTPGISEPEGPK